MQIALTKKLSEAMGINPPSMPEEENPLFSWTANWTKVWENRRVEDMLVLVNNATRFTVAIYQVKRKDLKNVDKMIKRAVSNTLLFMNLNPEIVDDYIRMCGEVTFYKNSNRQITTWVTKAGLGCAVHVGNEYNGIPKMFRDTIGASINYRPVNYSSDYSAGFIPQEAMFEALTKLTGKQTYKYRAFELLATLDLDIYKAVRRIIVPADLEFTELHKVLQTIFSWNNSHLYDFTVFDDKKRKPIAIIVPFEENLEHIENAVLIDGRVLSEFIPEYTKIIYTYDMGDNWEHEIKLVRVIDEYDKESPYLLEARGQTPPEDVGGVGGFLEFREIMLNPDHPDYIKMNEWAQYWTTELYEWESRPGAIYK